MKARAYVEYTHDEAVREIPYMLVTETFESGRNKTFTGKRIFKEMFTDEEDRKRVNELVKQAKKWALITGIPDKVKMTRETQIMWRRLADYCMNVG
jgi:hypothetical protein